MTHRRKGFTFLELTIVSGLMAFLALLLSATWTALGKPATDLIGRGQLVQEMNLAVAALSRDVGGGLANPEGRLGSKKLGRWVGWMQPTNAELWLCFDGGADPDGEPWEPLDTVISYYLAPDPDERVPTKILVRCDRTANTTFVVARNVDSMNVTGVAGRPDAFNLVLAFKYRNLTLTCHLAAEIP